MDRPDGRSGDRTLIHFVRLYALFWLVAGSVGLAERAQQPAPTQESVAQTTVASTSVAEAATGQTTEQTAGQTEPPAPATGYIFGTVTDSTEAVVSGAEVTLTSNATRSVRRAISSSTGQVDFQNVPAGAFQLTIICKGFAAATVNGTLQPGEVYTIPPISLQVESANTEVTVTPQTEHILAQQEVKQEEQQRVLGIAPNFFVTYSQNPVPLSSKQKFNLGLHDVLDPIRFVFAAGSAGFEQATDQFSGYGSGPDAYGERYGATLATSTDEELLTRSVFPTIFRQDPRYYYKGTGTKWERVKYALAMTVVCKGDNERWETNYSTLLGGLTAGAISNLYYPSSNRGASLTFESGGLSILGQAFENLAQEFVLRRFTKHAPPVGTLQP